ncbi:MAG: hypothetical protein HQK53_10530 [Oligoflexia bacterium]|nr:hypothetical protein [Oligoflexia bacterium]
MNSLLLFAKTFAKKNSICIVSILAASLILVKYLPFLGEHCGVEQDSGLALTLAKNLAQKGIYATDVNAQASPAQPVGPSIYGVPLIHDDVGHSYFDLTAVAVGPGFIVPQAILYKIFGVGWWQNRLWSLFSFWALLALSFHFMLIFGNFLSFLLFFTWIWGIPHFTINPSFEAYPVATTTLYMLISIYFFYYYLKNNLNYNSSKKTAYFWLLFSGVFAGVAFKTKSLALITFAAYALYYLFQIIKSKFSKLSSKLKEFIVLISGFLIPIVLYEAYRFYAIVNKFGIDAYYENNHMINQRLTSGDSGINFLSTILNNFPFIYRKIIIWEDVGISRPLLFWGMIIIIAILLLSQKKYLKNSNKKIIIGIIVTQISIHYTWFILTSPTGWMQHLWFSIYLGMMFCCLGISLIFEKMFTSNMFHFKGILFPKTAIRYVLLTACIIFITYDSTKFNFSPILSYGDLQRWNSNEFRFSRAVTREEKIWSRLSGEPRNPILNLNFQKEVVAFFKSKNNEKFRVYTPNGLLAPEISLMIDKVFFPLSSYSSSYSSSPERVDNSYLILNSYIYGLSPWKLYSFANSDYVDRLVRNSCASIVLINPQYLICLLTPH